MNNLDSILLDETPINGVDSQATESVEQVREPLTFETAFERLGTAKNTGHVSKLARRAAEAGLINLEKGIPYHEGMTAIEDSEESKNLIAAIRVRRAELAGEPTPAKTKKKPSTKKRPTSKPRKKAVEVREVSDDEIIESVIDNIGLVEEERMLEDIAFKLFRAGLITKTKRTKNNNFTWKVDVVEGVEGSDLLVEAINERKKIIKTRNLRFKALSALKGLGEKKK